MFEELLSELDKVLKKIIPILLQAAAVVWNFVMKLLLAIGLMPLFRKIPWLFVVVIVALIALVPPVGILLALVSFGALHGEPKAVNDFIISKQNTGND